MPPNFPRSRAPQHWCWTKSAAGKALGWDELVALAHLHPDAAADVIASIKRIEKGESRAQDASRLRGGLYEARGRNTQVQIRVLYFISSPHLTGTNAFKKKTRTVESQHIDLGLQRKAAWDPSQCNGSVLN
jgi:phage-related protein